MEITWYDGHNNYRKCIHTINDNKHHTFVTELLDVSLIQYKSILDCFHDLFAVRQSKTVEVLYSGGMDSECTLIACMKNNIPVRAITHRLLVNNYPINTHDLYYSTKFCTEHQVEQKIVDLHVDKFLENGDHVKYLSPYYITEPHVATHLWLLEQTSSFPVIGGEYSWPWVTEPLISPHRLEYSCYGRYMIDNGIHGIGNMLNHSMELNLFFIKEHVAIQRNTKTQRFDYANIPIFKNILMNNLGLGNLELRQKHYGWDNLNTAILNKGKYKIDLLRTLGVTSSKISWGKTIADAIDGLPASNYKYVL